MSQENVEIIRQAFEAWNVGDMESVGNSYDPEAVMRYQPGCVRAAKPGPAQPDCCWASWRLAPLPGG
jgi:hypothetical protein